jgi:hypothetical protein
MITGDFLTADLDESFFILPLTVFTFSLVILSTIYPISLNLLLLSQGLPVRLWTLQLGAMSK